MRHSRNNAQFDPSEPLVVSSAKLTVNETVYRRGEALPKGVGNEFFRKRFWASGRLQYAKDWGGPIETSDPQDGDLETLNVTDPKIFLTGDKTEDEQKTELVEKIALLGGKATKGKKLENLKAQFEELGGSVDPDPDSEPEVYENVSPEDPKFFAYDPDAEGAPTQNNRAELSARLRALGADVSDEDEAEGDFETLCELFRTEGGVIAHPDNIKYAAPETPEGENQEGAGDE